MERLTTENNALVSSGLSGITPNQSYKEQTEGRLCQGYEVHVYNVRIHDNHIVEKLVGSNLAMNVPEVGNFSLNKIDIPTISANRGTKEASDKTS